MGALLSAIAFSGRRRRTWMRGPPDDLYADAGAAAESATSTSWHRALTRRICSGVRQFASRSRGLATTMATARARETATLSLELSVPRLSDVTA